MSDAKGTKALFARLTFHTIIFTELANSFIMQQNATVMEMRVIASRTKAVFSKRLNSENAQKNAKIFTKHNPKITKIATPHWEREASTGIMVNLA